MALDYRPGYSRYLEGLSEPFVIAAEGREREKNRLLQKRRVDMEEKRAHLQDLRDQHKFALEQTDRKKKLVREIKDLAQGGELDEAQAVAAASQYIDPRTGKMASIGFNRGGEERLAPEQLGEAPRLTMPEEPKPFEGSTAGAPPPGMKLQLDPAIAAMQPRSTLPTKKTKPSYTIDGQQYEVDPAEGEEHKRRQSSEKAARYRESAARETDPVMRMSWLRAAEREEAQMGGAETAQQHRIETMENSQEFQGEQNALNRQNRIDVKKTRAPGGGGAGDSLKTQLKKQQLTNAELLEESKIDNAVRLNVLGPLGFKDMNTQARKIDDLVEIMSGADQNAALKTIGSGQMVKFSQGGTGVVSDQDMKVFWNDLGSFGMRAQDAWNGFIRGTLSADKKAVVEKALAKLQSSATNRVNQIGQKIEHFLNDYPGGPERMDRYIGTFSPGYMETRRARQAKSGNQDALQQMDAEADEWLKGIK